MMSSVKPYLARIKALWMSLFSVIVISVMSIQSANAQDIEQGTQQKEEIAPRLAWRDWKTVGQAKLSWLFFDIYHSKLLSPSGRYQLTQDITPHPIALNITYLREISSTQLLESTDEQWMEIGIGTPATRKDWIQKLSHTFSDVDYGDQLTYVTDGIKGWLWFKPQNGIEQLKGSVDDQALNDAFLAIWLSPETNYPKLRSQLIKGN